jgi:hypothetical protein
MNSVLQCLTHTPPLAELCLSDKQLSLDHDPQQFDPIAATQSHIKKAYASQSSIRPIFHARSLKLINRR